MKFEGIWVLGRYNLVKQTINYVLPKLQNFNKKINLDKIGFYIDQYVVYKFEIRQKYLNKFTRFATQMRWN